MTQDSSRPTYFKEHFFLFFWILVPKMRVKKIYIYDFIFMSIIIIIIFHVSSTSGLRITGWKTLINKRPSGISCKWHVQNVKIKACTYIISCDNTYSTRDECKIWLSFKYMMKLKFKIWISLGLHVEIPLIDRFGTEACGEVLLWKSYKI